MTTTFENWRINRELAEDRLKVLWNSGDHDQPLYLVEDKYTGWKPCYHIITKDDFNNSPHWAGVQFVKSIGEENVTKKD